MKSRRVPQVTTLESLVDLYRDSPAFHQLSPNWKAYVVHVIDTVILPELGSKKVDAIRRGQLIQLLELTIARGETLANHTKRILTRIFNWAYDREFIENNPAMRLPFPARTVKRDRVLTDDEIASVWQACEDEGTVTHRLFQMVLATAQRPGELKLAKWEDIDGDFLILRKTKNGSTHRAYLGVEGLRIVEKLRGVGHVPRHSREYLFPAVRVDSEVGFLSNYNTAWGRMRRRLGLEDATCYDLRRTAATKVAQQGGSMDVVARILNHTPQNVTSIYQRYGYEKEVVIAVNAWHSRLQQLTSLPAVGG